MNLQTLREIVATLDLPKETKDLIFTAYQNGYNEGTKKGFSDGFDAGFTCAEIACNCNITEAQNQYDQEPTAPANGKDTSAGVPGPSFEPIAGIDFKTGVDGLFDSIKVICEDYNKKLLKP